MIYPTIDQLTRGIYNRYELVIATAKAARKITDIQCKKREEIKKYADDKDSRQDKTYPKMDFALPDEKAVKIAIMKIYNGELIIRRPE